MDQQTLDRIQIAESLALQARVAALAGDHQRARELRAQLDSLWDEIEGQALDSSALLPADSHNPAIVAASGYANP